MKKLSFFFVPLFITLIFTSCDWFTSPEELEPGRRDYAWEEDTIKVPEGYYTSMSRIWGSSPTDIWICGNAYISDHTIWHFDGSEWLNIEVEGFISPFAIYGFSQNDVWFGTLESSIWHWNGQELNLFGHYTLPEYEDINIQSMWGPSPSEIYAVGYGRNLVEDKTVGVIMRYNGSDWLFDQVYEERLTFLSIREYSNSGLYFINSYCYGGVQTPYKLFTIHNNTVNKTYESDQYIGLEEISGKIFIRQNRQVLKYTNNNFELWKDFSNTQFVARIWGRNESDFFTVNSNGLGHYNGSKLITLYEMDYKIENIQLFEKDIFILCEDSQSNCDIIVHGKLN